MTKNTIKYESSVTFHSRRGLGVNSILLLKLLIVILGVFFKKLITKIEKIQQHIIELDLRLQGISDA